MQEQLQYSRFLAEPGGPGEPGLYNSLRLPGAPLLKWLWQATQSFIQK